MFNITMFLAASFNWFLAALVTQFYGPLSSWVGPAPTFWTFAVLMVAALVHCLLCVPETKGLTLEDIQQLFRSLPAGERGEHEDDQRRLVVEVEDTGENDDDDGERTDQQLET